jgi:hypothetical protein
MPAQGGILLLAPPSVFITTYLLLLDYGYEYHSGFSLVPPYGPALAR